MHPPAEVSHYYTMLCKICLSEILVRDCLYISSEFPSKDSQKKSFNKSRKTSRKILAICPWVSPERKKKGKVT